jgi:hypothetical protein
MQGGSFNFRITRGGCKATTSIIGSIEVPGITKVTPAASIQPMVEAARQRATSRDVYRGGLIHRAL